MTSTLGAGVIDRVYARGKKKNIRPGFAASFCSGLKVMIASEDGKELRGYATVEHVDEAGNIVKLDGIPAGTIVGDVIVLRPDGN